MSIGQIFKIHSDFYYVNSDGVLHECKVREVLKKTKQTLYVGDFVEFSDGAIEKILPRLNFIPRPSVANVDQVVIISSVKEPDLSFTQLNRYIAFAQYYHLKVLLCFNKNDLSSDDKIIEKVFKIYEPLGFEILFTSALEGYGIDDFYELLKEKSSVLCGSSGVGKSSLINALNPNLNLRTGSVSEKSSRGTHTTRHCEILEIEKGTRIIDTPGFSNLKFNFLLPTEIDSFFPEINKYKKQCKFQDCLHQGEAGCEVEKHLQDIDETRYKSYLEFVNESKAYKEKIKYQGVKTESFHKYKNNDIAVKISHKKRESARNTQKQTIYKDYDNGEFD